MSNPYSAADFEQRLFSTLPQPWFSTAAGTPVVAGSQSNSQIRSFCNAFGVSLSFMWGLFQYVQAQTRLATVTDVNVDNAAVDFFGFGNFPRGPQESDSAFAFRIRQQIVLPQPTLAGIQQVVQNYLTAYVGTSLLAAALGLDAVGALDIQGAMDILGGLNTVPVVPLVQVFDQTSNPKLAAVLSPTPLTNPQFCILTSYPNISTTDAFFLGRNHVTPQTSRNLIPNSQLASSASGWTNTGLTLGTLGPGGFPSWSYTGTGAASGFPNALSGACPVTPGGIYTVSCYVDASAVPAGSSAAGIYVTDAAQSVWYAYVIQPSGQVGVLSTTFVVPAGVTSVYFYPDTNNQVVNNGGVVVWSQPQLEPGYNATPYVATGNYSNHESHLMYTQMQTVGALSSGLAALVALVKAEGTIPVWAQNLAGY